MEGHNWNVVVVGFWNPAILTPSGISQRLFGREPGLPIEVEVPMDGFSPVRVIHAGCRVEVHRRELIVTATEASYENLQAAIDVAARALDDLPETPVFAAGVNVRFSALDLDSDVLGRDLPGLDRRISDGGYTIDARTVSRQLAFDLGGSINLTIESGVETDSIVVNYHLGATSHADLVRWLSTVRSAVSSRTSGLLQCLGIR